MRFFDWVESGTFFIIFRTYSFKYYVNLSPTVHNDPLLILSIKRGELTLLKAILLMENFLSS